MKLVKFFVFFLFMLMCGRPSNAEPLRWQNDKISWTAYTDDSHILLKAQLYNGWHISWINPGEAGVPVAFNWENTTGLQIRKIAQSSPEKFVYDDILSLYGYGNTAYYLFKIDPKVKNNLILNLSWTACKDYCQPEEARFIFTDPAEKSDPYRPAVYAEAAATFPQKTDWQWRAEVNGDILRLTIDTGSDILSPDGETDGFIPLQRGIIPASVPQDITFSGKHTILIETESENGQLPDQGGLFIYNGKSYALPPLNTAGRLSFSLLITAFLAGIILNLMPCVFPVLSLKALALSNSSPTSGHLAKALMYLFGVVCCFMAIALILYLLRISGESIGWGFQLQSPWFVGCMLVVFVVIFLMMTDVIKLNGRLAGMFDRLSRANSFLTGFFAVLIASPCTGPLMGAVLGYALLQPARIYFPVFLALGLGYALPFTLIELFPKITAAVMPKPGKWMQRLKYVLSVPVFLTCLWLSWVLYHQLSARENKNTLWQPYDPQKAAGLIAQNQPVFIDFTAKWCLTCLLNERTTLFSGDFEQAAAENGVTLFKADWTNREDMISDALENYGRGSVPLYIFYPANSRGKYVVLPQLLTPETALEYLRGQNQNHD